MKLKLLLLTITFFVSGCGLDPFQESFWRDPPMNPDQISTYQQWNQQNQNAQTQTQMQQMQNNINTLQMQQFNARMDAIRSQYHKY